jgi:glycosyltransferase involved in cell wall biosynthesis
LKILFITNNFPPLTCGVGDYSYQLTKQLIEKGHEVYVVCRTDTRIQSFLDNNKQRTSIYPVGGNWERKDWIRVCKLIHDIKPDFVLFQYVPYAYNKYGLPFFLPYYLYKIHLLSKLIITVHEVRIKIDWRNWKSVLIGMPMFFISYLVSQIGTQLITTNPFYAKLLTHPQKTHIVRVPSNFNIELFPENRIKTVKAKWGMGANIITVGTFGLGVRGLNYILESIAEICKDQFPIKLILIGNYKDDKKVEIEKAIQKWGIKDHVMITGFVPTEEINEVLQILDIYLMLEPTHSANTWTGTGSKSGTLATAFAAGLPVIGTKGEMTDDFFRDQENIYLLNHLNVEELTKAILDLAHHPQKRQQIGKEALASYHQSLSWQVVANQYEKILQNNF